MGIKDGDRVKLVNQDGLTSATDTVVLVTPGIKTDAVFLPHGYGMRNPMLEIAKDKGMDDQSLCSANCVDPHTGTHGIRTNFVRLVKDGKTISFPI
jgi:thiosulfate reductase/polysulfide reductase chain A